MRYLVFNALAMKENYKTSMQLGENCNINILEKYLKNALVSLASAKQNNPDIDVQLYVNFEVSEKYKLQFEQAEVMIKKSEFETFVLPEEYQWAIAFYKLHILKYVVENLDYDKYMLLDTDTYTVSNFDDLWNECNSGILLFDLDHRLSHPDRKCIIDNIKIIGDYKDNIIHYGGEFIAGARENLKIFIKNCSFIFDKMTLINNLDRSLGDEFIISLAAHLMKYNIIRANRYIYRYWTGNFYLASTNFINNSVDIWHLPAEKDNGMIWMYKYYIKNKSFPNIKRSAKVFGFPRTSSSMEHKMFKLKSKIYNIIMNYCIKLKSHKLAHRKL
jgi:hypothetical protein